MNHAKQEIPFKYLDKWQNTINTMARIFKVPASLIMRVWPETIEVLVASQTEGNPYEKNEMAHLGTGLYCEEVMRKREQLYIPNALEDEKWKSNPDVKLNMIHYLGVPLVWPDDEIFGTICVLDNKTRHYSQEYFDLLWEFKKIIESDMQLLSSQKELESAMERIKVLSGMLPICSKCKKIRDDKGYWNQLEIYISQHSDAVFSHGLCPSCYDEYIAEIHNYKNRK